MDGDTPQERMTEVGFVGKSGLLTFAHLTKPLPSGTKLFDASGVERARTGWANPHEVHLRTSNLPCGLALFAPEADVSRARREADTRQGIPVAVLCSEDFARCVLLAFKVEKVRCSEAQAMQRAIEEALQTCAAKR